MAPALAVSTIAVHKAETSAATRELEQCSEHVPLEAKGGITTTPIPRHTGATDHSSRYPQHEQLKRRHATSTPEVRLHLRKTQMKQENLLVMWLLVMVFGTTAQSVIPGRWPACALTVRIQPIDRTNFPASHNACRSHRGQCRGAPSDAPPGYIAWHSVTAPHVPFEFSLSPH